MVWWVSLVQDTAYVIRQFSVICHLVHLVQCSPKYEFCETNSLTKYQEVQTPLVHFDWNDLKILIGKRNAKDLYV